MNIEEFREYCMGKKAVTEDMPFGEDVVAFRVLGKIFALSNINEKPLKVNLKCDPSWSEKLREEYHEIVPGYHMNKKHWNTVAIESPNIPQKLKEELIDHSYDLIVQGMTKEERAKIIGDE